MHPPNLNSTETSLGASHQRDDFLGQEASKSRVARWVRTIAGVVFVFLVVSILAAIVVGIERLGYWGGAYLVPVAVILGVITAVLALLVWVIERSPDPPYRDRLQ
jgi:hypothetical protein